VDYFFEAHRYRFHQHPSRFSSACPARASRGDASCNRGYFSASITFFFFHIST
jgi:hypothetical protein